MKKQIYITIITIIVIFSCASVVPASAEIGDRGEFYPRLTVIIDRIDTKVYCRDKDGDVWIFFDEKEEWEKGDIANLFMWNKGTHENHDEIIEVYWEGYTEDIDEFFYLMGWQ